MSRHWNVASDCFEISEMPFYWRLSEATEGAAGILSKLPIRVTADPGYDYLKFQPTEIEWSNIDKAYQQNENIGFVNPDSGQLQTYGSSVNNFFLASLQKFTPTTIYEIGCGAGFTIKFLKENGWEVVGIDPSEYSLKWSDVLGFSLINQFFTAELLEDPASFIYCNDVFEHVPHVEKFSKIVYDSLEEGGVFCFATTNSTQSIAIGDISMFEHQHVNMFTEKSIHLILREAGFSDIHIQGGSYGNTFHVTAVRRKSGYHTPLPVTDISCEGFFERACRRVEAFGRFYAEAEDLQCYVPLRSIPYLATVGDFGDCPVYDSNEAWRGKYIDGYKSPIRSPEDIEFSQGSRFFIGSLTFYGEIKKMLVELGVPRDSIRSIKDLK